MNQPKTPKTARVRSARRRSVGIGSSCRGPGITDTSIKIGVSGALTGPVAALGAIDEGIRTKVEAVNTAGGVKMGDGKTRKIELVIDDDVPCPGSSLRNPKGWSIPHPDLPIRIGAPDGGSRFNADRHTSLTATPPLISNSRLAMS